MTKKATFKKLPIVGLAALYERRDCDLRIYFIPIVLSTMLCTQKKGTSY